MNLGQEDRTELYGCRKCLLDLFEAVVTKQVRRELALGGSPVKAQCFVQVGASAGAQGKRQHVMDHPTMDSWDWRPRG